MIEDASLRSSIIVGEQSQMNLHAWFKHISPHCFYAKFVAVVYLHLMALIFLWVRSAVRLLCCFFTHRWTICRISVTFVDKDGEEKHIKVPTGMSMLEAAHENDIELEGKVLILI